MTEEISRGDYFQHNYKSDFQGGCYTYDWSIEGPFDANKEDDILELTFENVSEGDVMIKKPLLITHDGRVQPFKRILNEPGKVVYRGKCPDPTNRLVKVRYWRPSGIDGNIADTIRVTENWFNSTIIEEENPNVSTEE